MTGGGHPPGGEDVVVTKLPMIKAAFDAEFIDQAYHGEIGLIDTESAEGPRRGVVGVVGTGHDVHAGHMVGRRGMAPGTGDHLAANRGVSPGVPHDPGSQRRELASFIAGQFVVHLHAVALGVHANGLGAIKAYLDRALQCHSV